MASVHSNFLIVSLVIFSFSFLTLGSLDRMLEIYELPRGLFPKNVKGYSLDQDMVLEVQLETPCLAMFESFVFYEKVVRANISQGKLLDIKGLSNKELFLWLPVKAIVVNYPDCGVVMFDITVANKTVSLSLFDEPPSCQSEVQMPSKPKKGGNKKESGSGFDRVKKVVSSILLGYL